MNLEDMNLEDFRATRKSFDSADDAIVHLQRRHPSNPDAVDLAADFAVEVIQHLRTKINLRRVHVYADDAIILETDDYFILGEMMGELMGEDTLAEAEAELFSDLI